MLLDLGEIKTKLSSIFEDVTAPQRVRGAALLEELKKPEAEIDETKCLNLIRRGVNLTYKYWPMADANGGDSLLESMAEAATGTLHAKPTDPEAFIMACAKGKTAVVSALLENKIIHPAQWDRHTGENGKIAAAKAGQLDVIKCLDDFKDKIRGVYQPDRLAGDELKNISRSEIERLRLAQSRYLAYQAIDGRDNNGKDAYTYVKETGRTDIIDYMLKRAMNEAMETSYFRPSERGYADEEKWWLKYIQDEKDESRRMRAQAPAGKQQATPAPKK